MSVKVASGYGASSEMQFSSFAVDEEPYCLWDWDIRNLNQRFLDSFDPEYFEHVANMNGQLLEGDQKKYAATALRIGYSHGLESLFALLCATVQAPDCIIGWFLRYRNRDLYSLARKISERERVHSKLRIDPLTWRSLAGVVHSFFTTGELEKDKRTREAFGELWERFAVDFLDENLALEYNSIKHGFRVKLGGFYFALGAEDVPGVAAAPERMRVLAHSQFGSSFFATERLGDKRNFSVSHDSVNWSPENYIYALHLISMSIANVTGFVKVLGGIDPSTVRFSWPSNQSMFEKPWSESTGITWLGRPSGVRGNNINPRSSAEILSVYDDSGVHR